MLPCCKPINIITQKITNFKPLKGIKMTDYKEFAKKIKEKYPQYKNVDDEKLAQKMIEKYPQYKKQVTFEIGKNNDTNKKEPVRPKVTINKSELDLSKDFTPSGLAKRGAQNVSALLRMPMYGEDFNTAKQNARINQILFEKKHPVIMGGAEFVNDLAGYSALPILRGQGLVKGTGAFLGNSIIQGGVPGTLEALKAGESPLKGAGTGTGIAALLQSVPYVGKFTKAPINYIGKKAIEGLTDLKPETLQQVIKPNSKALDLTEKEAQNLLMNTTERVRNDYNALLNEKGNTVGNLLQELPENAQFKTNDLTNLYDGILNNYSLSKNEALNPAINATEKELNKIKDLLYGDGKQRYGEFQQNIKDLEFPKNYLDTITNRYKNTYHKKVLDTINNDIVYAQRNFNNNILDKIRKNPEILQNPEQLAELEQEVSKYARFPYDEVNQEFYDKFYDAIGKGNILQKGENFVNPKELYDINKNISNMIDWDKPGAAYKNDILEQIYGVNAKKISDLSPALKQANKEYSDLMDFQKNEGIRRIINNNNNIDTASSAIKNYNSTVTKGNTNRNVQDLEKILTDNGYSPFINDVDDVNAAMDLLTQPKTGRNFLGAQTIAKGLTIPALKSIRWANQKNIPQKIQVIRPLGRTIPTSAAMGTSNLLYGGVNNYEDEMNPQNFDYGY